LEKAIIACEYVVEECLQSVYENDKTAHNTLEIYRKTLEDYKSELEDKTSNNISLNPLKVNIDGMV
jgi:hypothetical protein